MLTLLTLEDATGGKIDAGPLATSEQYLMQKEIGPVQVIHGKERPRVVPAPHRVAEEPKEESGGWHRG